MARGSRASPTGASGHTWHHPDERFPSAVQFLKDAVAYYQRLGVTIQRLLTDNGSAFRSRAFAALCHELGIKHRFTRPYRPQTNGKAERFIQSALREWAYAHTYQNSQHRADAMKSWLHHYNWHRPHQGIGRAVPISRLNLDEYNLLPSRGPGPARPCSGRASGARRARWRGQEAGARRRARAWPGGVWTAWLAAWPPRLVTDIPLHPPRSGHVHAS
ncbi:transposase [Bordetella pertussis]|nr:transposase [Bordetella pertussis]CFP44651.1 transposase [Bordetella pertussis]